MKHRYFAASNSSQGFKNYYPEIFREADFLYIIKGGPGTGKSSFMSRIARTSERDGAECEYYYCSSDPHSLDGILIKNEEKTIGVIDGTSPHLSEPCFPGAREEIINLGQFWDNRILQAQQNEIVSLTEKKAGEYKNAYTYLRSVGNLRAVNDSLVVDSVDRQKMRAALQRLISDIPAAEGLNDFRAKKAILDSVSMRGRYRFDTFEQNAEIIYAVERFYGVEHLILEELHELLKGKKVFIRVSYDPVCCDHIDGIFIEDKKIAFVIPPHNDPEMSFLTTYEKTEENKPPVFFNSRRFVDIDVIREVRGELRYTAKLAQSSLDGALHSLEKARVYHFLLENIYGNAMMWQKLTEFEKSFVL